MKGLLKRSSTDPEAGTEEEEDETKAEADAATISSPDEEAPKLAALKNNKKAERLDKKS